MYFELIGYMSASENRVNDLNVLVKVKWQYATDDCPPARKNVMEVGKEISIYWI